MSELRSLLDQLASLDPAALDPGELADPDLLAALPAMQTTLNQLCALQTRAVAAADRREATRADGMVATRTWLTGHCRIAGRDATALLRAARRLDRLPHLAAAYAAGAVTPAHVEVITAAVTPARITVAEANGIDLATTDTTLTRAATTLGPEDTATVVRRWVQGIDPDGALDDAAGRPRIFRMALSAQGRIHLSGHLDPVGGEYLHTALEALMNGDRPAGDTRTHSQRQGDAPVELARRALRAGDLPTVRGATTTIRVTIDWFALCATRAAPGIAGGTLACAGPITPETARRLACDAGIVRILTDPAGLPLDVGQRPLRRGPPRACERWGAEWSFHSPVAPHPPPGAMCTTSGTGPTAGPPPARTAPCSANGTTPPSTKAASPSPATPAPPPGTPTAQAAPKSSSRPPPGSAHHPDPGSGRRPLVEGIGIARDTGALEVDGGLRLLAEAQASGLPLSRW